MPVEITVKQADLGDILGAMRLWLDQEKCVLSNFRHAQDGMGHVTIKADFVERACAEAFQQHFGKR